jgi:hypothetical protein
VRANGCVSELFSVISGVPQGTVLGPVLFIIMLQDIDSKVLAAIVGSFADDTRVTKTIKVAEDVAILQRDLDSIYNWCQINKMLLNDAKFERLSYCCKTSNCLTDEYEYITPNCLPIENKHNLRDLGVQVQNDLSFDQHINNISAAARRKCGYIFCSFKTRDPTTMMVLYKSLVRSKLDYNAPLWNPYCQKEINQIESVQRNYTNRLNGLSDLN